MSRNLYTFKLPFDSEYDLLRKFLTFYTMCHNLKKGKNYLRPKLVDVLTYYIIKGYSEDTKNFILQSNPELKRTNLNQINAELTKKGYLVKVGFRNNEKALAATVEALKDYIEAEKHSHPIFAIKFING